MLSKLFRQPMKGFCVEPVNSFFCTTAETKIKEEERENVLPKLVVWDGNSNQH